MIRIISQQYMDTNNTSSQHLSMCPPRHQITLSAKWSEHDTRINIVQLTQQSLTLYHRINYWLNCC